MFFLLRTAFWLSIVVLLLPADPAKRDSARPQLGTLETLGVAQAAFEDARGFCARRPEACEAGSIALSSFGEKAQYGAKLLYGLISDKLGDESAKQVEAGERPGRHTLTPTDVTPAWKASETPADERRQVPLPPRRPA
jgi:uncharacterized protein DUF5330